MSPNTACRRRAAFFSMVAITAGMVLLVLAVLLNRLSFASIVRERTALMESAASQVMGSARNWSQSHDFAAEELEITLPIDKMLAPDMTGSAVLRRRTGEPAMVDCEVLLKRGSHGVTRRSSWALPVRP